MALKIKMAVSDLNPQSLATGFFFFSFLHANVSRKMLTANLIRPGLHCLMVRLPTHHFPSRLYMMKRHWAPTIQMDSMSRYAIFATGLENLVH